MLLVILAVTTLFAMVGTTIAAQTEATPKAQDNVAVGEAEVKQMLPLMDEDKDGNFPSRISWNLWKPNSTGWIGTKRESSTLRN
jgi:hypothetical protein